MKKRVLSIFTALMVLIGSIMIGIMSLPVFAQENELLINNCDSLTGWTKTGGNALAINQNGFGAGSKSIACDINSGAFRTATYTAAQPVDISSYKNLQWDVMMHNGGKPGMWDEISKYYGNEVYVKIGSSTTDYNVYRLSKMSVTQDSGNNLWYHFSVDIANPTTSTGSFNPAAMNIFYFTTIDGAVNSSVRNGHIRIDNIYARNLKEQEPGEVEDKLLSPCETLDNWSYAGNTANLSINPNGMTNNAIHVYTGYGALRELKYTQSYDLSGYNMIEFDMMCMRENVTDFDMWGAVTAAYGNKIGVKLSDGTATNTYGLNKFDVTAVGNNWYHVKINIDDPSSKNGSLNLKNFNSFSIYTNTTGVLDDTLNNAIYRFDNLIAKYDADVTVPDDDGIWPIDGSFNKTTTGNFNFTVDGFSHNLSKYQLNDIYLLMSFYIENTNGTNDVSGFTTDGQVELTSSGQPDKQEANWSVPKLGLKSGWNHLRISLANSNGNNGLDLKNINYLRIYSKTGSADTFIVKIQDIKLTTIKEESIVNSFFADGMMFQQNKPINLFGNVKEANKNISATIFKGSTVVSTGTGVSENGGAWEIALPAIKGGYSEYSIEISVDGKLTKTISGILIGELWLAAGQSNMEFFVLQTIPNYDYSLIPLNENVRFFDIPLVPGGVASTLPSSPASDIEGAKWSDGSTPVNVLYVSAIAYYMSLKLQDELNVPVAFINAAKGASVIESWLPRQSVEGNATIKSTLQNRGIYKTEAQLDQTPANWTYLTTLFNTKIAPLKGVNISGVLWYQGESNVKYCDDNGYNTYYEQSLTELISAYSDMFGFNGDMPFVCAQLAPYNYQSVRPNDYTTILASFAEMLTNVTKNSPAKVMQIPIYDVSLEYSNPPINNPDPIHPSNKNAVAGRFANAVLAGVYGVGNSDARTAPTYKSMNISGNKLVLTFDNAGDTLGVLPGETDIHGFAVCGSDRVFVKANAILTSSNTIEVWSDYVSSPVAATYAWDSFNLSANLCNSAGIPAASFRTDKANSTYYMSADWALCDDRYTWDARTTLEAGYKPAWKVSSNVISDLDNTVKYEGTGSLKLNYTMDGAATAYAEPVYGYGGMVKQFQSYSGATIYVKNSDTRNKKLSLEIISGGDTYYASIITGTTLEKFYDLPAAGGFTAYTFNFARLMNTEGKVLTDSSIAIKNLTSLRFVISDNAGGSAYLDNVVLRTDKLPTPGSGSDDIVDPDEDTSAGAIDKDGNMWLSDGESTSGWSVSGGTLVVDPSKSTQGKNSIGTTAPGGVLKQIAFISDTSLNVGEYDYLEMDIYFSNNEWFNPSTGVMFEMTSSGTSDKESSRYMKGYLKDNCQDFYNDAVSGKGGKWYHIKLDIKNPQSQANGGMNKNAFNFFRFYAIGAPSDTKDFDIRLDNLKFTKTKGTSNPDDDNKGGDSSYGVVIDDTSMWMSTAETLYWWDASSGAIALNTDNKTQGNGSVSVTAPGGILKQIAFTPKKDLDISQYQFVEFDAYFSNLDWYRASTGLMFEFTSSGKSDVESNRYMKSALLEGSPAFASDIESGAKGGKWYHFKLSLKTPQGKAKGGLDLTKFNFFRFYTIGASAGTADYTMCLDNMKFTRGADTSKDMVKTDDYMIISSADSTAGWSASGLEVMIDRKNKVSGTGSVSVMAKGGILKQLAYQPSDPIDLTGYNYLEFDLYLSDITCLSNSTGFMVEATSSGGCDVESNRYMKSAILAACPELAADIQSGATGGKWYHFNFNLTRPQNQAKGGLNVKAFNFFRIYFIGAPAGTPDCVVNIDNLKVTRNGNGVTGGGTGGGTGTIIGGSGTGSGKNVGNKVNNGLSADVKIVTESAKGLMVTASVLGGAIIIILLGTAATLIVLRRKSKRIN